MTQLQPRTVHRNKRDLCLNCGVMRYQGHGKWEPDWGKCVDGTPGHTWVPRREFLKRRRVPRDTPEGTWSAAEAYQLRPGKLYRVIGVNEQKSLDRTNQRVIYLQYAVENEQIALAELSAIYFDTLEAKPGDRVRFRGTPKVRKTS